MNEEINIEEINDEQKDEDKLQYINLTYIGKDYMKDFQNEDGITNKSYKYKFKQSMDDQYTRNFWGYSDTKGVELLKDGEMFCVGFKEAPNPKGEAPLKKVRWFGAPKQDLQQQQTTSTTVATEPATGNMEAAATNTVDTKPMFDVKWFAEQFRDTDKIEMADKTLNRFIAAFVKSTNKDQYILLDEMFNEVVHPKVAEPKPDFS